MPTPPVSIPHVIEVSTVRGSAAPADAAADLLVEVPHGATRTEDFTSLAARLQSPLPPSLIDFFHVNTDTGAFELAEATARCFVGAAPTRTVQLLRCKIPRTFIDCNRRIDAAPEEFKAGKVTPGLMPWITHEADRVLLRGLYQQYVNTVHLAVDALAPRAAILALHSYAPRSVDVEVDAQIVENLHRAYEPEVEKTWPLRPEIDVIGRGVDGTDYAPAEVMRALVANFAALGIEVADSKTYPLHPSTLAWDHVLRHPGRALCVEVRRDLLAEPFAPFVEMRIGAARLERLAAPLASALQRWW